MTQRQERVSSVLRRELAEHIRLQDYEQIRGFLTLTHVEVTADLGQAEVFFAVVGQEPMEVKKILESQRSKIQRMLGEKFKMKKIPRVSFTVDRSGEYAARIKKLINEIHQDDPA